MERHKPWKDIFDDNILFLDFSALAATLNGVPINLSVMEFRMPDLFRENPRQVLTRQRLFEKESTEVGKGASFSIFLPLR